MVRPVQYGGGGGRNAAPTAVARMRITFTTVIAFVLLSLLGWCVFFLSLHSDILKQIKLNEEWMNASPYALLQPRQGNNNGQQQQQQQQQSSRQGGHHESLLDLAQAQRRVMELEKQLEDMQQQPKSSSQNIDCPKEEDSVTSRQQQWGNNNDNNNNNNRNPVCKALPQPIPSAAALWKQYIPDIHRASQLPNDIRYSFHDFTAQLLQLVSPRMSTSVKTIPREWQQLDTILQVAYERFQYVQNPQAWPVHEKPPPRPVRIVIMGGSLLVGMNCRRLIKQLNLQIQLPLRDCSWANRLEKILNQFLLDKILGMKRNEELDTLYIVQVTKIAMGGTNTGTGTVILEYDLIPPEAKNPDIIINAYSTNDMHIVTMMEAQSGNATLREKVFEMTQDFVRRVMEPPPLCAGADADATPLPPMMFHMDDYLGNEQREIWATTELSQGVQVLANYYGFPSASYADLVRDFVYGDTREYWFSPEGWYDGHGQFEREIHPNMGMHIVSAWVVAYNFLNMVTTYCSLESWGIKTGPMMEYGKGLNNLPVLKGQVLPKGKPKRPPTGLKPVLTKDLSLEHITQQWQSASNGILSQSAAGQRPACDDNTSVVKCPFSWLSGISSMVTKPSQLEEFFQKHTRFSGDWTFKDDHGKLGIVPSAPMSTMTLELPELAQSVRTVTVFYMKSYGENWADSTVRVQCFQKKHLSGDEWELLRQSEFVGYHDKHTSETYTELLDMSNDPAEAGGSLRIQVTLVKGTTFKIMGLAICS